MMAPPSEAVPRHESCTPLDRYIGFCASLSPHTHAMQTPLPHSHVVCSISYSVDSFRPPVPKLPPIALLVPCLKEFSPLFGILRDHQRHRPDADAGDTRKKKQENTRMDAVEHFDTRFESETQVSGKMHTSKTG